MFGNHNFQIFSITNNDFNTANMLFSFLSLVRLALDPTKCHIFILLPCYAYVYHWPDLIFRQNTHNQRRFELIVLKALVNLNNKLPSIQHNQFWLTWFLGVVTAILHDHTLTQMNQHSIKMPSTIEKKTNKTSQLIVVNIENGQQQCEGKKTSDSINIKWMWL